MLVLNLRAFENKKYAAYDRFHGNGPYGEIPTKKEPIRTLKFAVPYNKYMLFAGWEVRIVKNCEQGLENTSRGRRPKAAFSSPRSQFFTIRTNPKLVNNLFIFFLSLERLWKNLRKRYCDHGQR